VERKETSGNIENRWLEFYQSFIIEHRDFVKALMEAHPNLSSAQYKVCAYLHAGFSTQKISEELALSLRSIENQRYRLRKKFNLRSEEKLEAFLMKYE
jgi:DNA-binding NarL/FixJ family response regulator